MSGSVKKYDKKAFIPQNTLKSMFTKTMGLEQISRGEFEMLNTSRANPRLSYARITHPYGADSVDELFLKILNHPYADEIGVMNGPESKKLYTTRVTWDGLLDMQEILLAPGIPKLSVWIARRVDNEKVDRALITFKKFENEYLTTSLSISESHRDLFDFEGTGSVRAIWVPTYVWNKSVIADYDSSLLPSSSFSPL